MKGDYMQSLNGNNDLNRIAQGNNAVPIMKLDGNDVSAPTLKFKRPQEVISDLKVESDEIKFTATVINPKEAPQKEVKVSKQILSSSEAPDTAPTNTKNGTEIKVKVTTVYTKFQNFSDDTAIKQSEGGKPREIKVKELKGAEFSNFTNKFQKSKTGYVVTIKAEGQEIKLKKGKITSENDFLLTPKGFAIKESQLRNHPDFINYQHVHSSKLSDKDINKINKLLQNETVYVVSDEQFEQLVEIHNTKIDVKQAKLDKAENENSKETEVLDFHATPRKLDPVGGKEKSRENQIFEKHFPLGTDLFINNRNKNEKANEERHKDEAWELKKESIRKAIQEQEGVIAEHKEIAKNDYLKHEAQA